jgi:hypothetical protein
MDGNVKVVFANTVANLVVKREDGHTLSLSSMGKNLCEFDKQGECVKDHGMVAGALTLLKLLNEFLDSPMELVEQ